MTGMRIWFPLLIMTLFGGAAMAADTPRDTAIFAGGCFWCMQPEFDSAQGVIGTRVGFSGGDVANPTYEQVTSGNTGHYEAIEVTFDPSKITYEKLLDIYWGNIDPLDAGGQFHDRGDHYETVIFVNGDAQRTAAEASKAKVEKFFAPKPVATKILSAKPFYPAEDYHQRYYEKSSTRYKAYKNASGREDKLKQLWQKNLRQPMPATGN